jgi:uncharacterized protein with PQ loop repeat
VNFYNITVAVGWIAVILSVVVAYTQFKRMSERGTEGVSLATWTLFLYLDIFWILYGIGVHSWQLIIGCSIALPLQLMIWFRLNPRENIRVSFHSLLLFTAFSVLPALKWGWAGASVGAGMVGWVTRAPQLLHLVRHEGATGVSTSSWTTAGIGSGLWVLYYFGARLWPVMYVTAVGGLVSLIVASLAGWRHRQARLSQLDLPAFS